MDNNFAIRTIEFPDGSTKQERLFDNEVFLGSNLGLIFITKFILSAYSIVEISEDKLYIVVERNK